MRGSSCASQALTWSIPRKLRLRFVDFLVRMCERLAARCFQPLPVFLNRFRAPEFVLIFGIFFPLQDVNEQDRGALLHFAINFQAVDESTTCLSAT